jgi:hypothetical protein
VCTPSFPTANACGPGSIPFICHDGDDENLGCYPENLVCDLDSNCLDETSCEDLGEFVVRNSRLKVKKKLRVVLYSLNSLQNVIANIPMARGMSLRSHFGTWLLEKVATSVTLFQALFHLEEVPMISVIEFVMMKMLLRSTWILQSYSTTTDRQKSMYANFKV